MGMDGLLASAYVLLGLTMGYMIGLLVRRSYVDGTSPGGGEATSTPPPGWEPDDWVAWEQELTETIAHAES
jgi:hypothetical protein